MIVVDAKDIDQVTVKQDGPSSYNSVGRAVGRLEGERRAGRSIEGRRLARRSEAGKPLVAGSHIDRDKVEARFGELQPLRADNLERLGHWKPAACIRESAIILAIAMPSPKPGSDT
jgi:hypothetical protein